MAEETKKKKREKKTTLALVPEQLEKLTKEELIDFIIEHKREIVVCPTKAQPELPDFSKAEFLHVAFSIAYCGHNYQVFLHVTTATGTGGAGKYARHGGGEAVRGSPKDVSHRRLEEMVSWD